MNREQRRRLVPQRGYTQILSPAIEGGRLAKAKASGLKISPKHCFDICRAIKGMQAGDAIEYLEAVMIRRKAVPGVAGGGNKKRARGGARKMGHRKGRIGPGRYPNKASAAMIQLIRSAMANAEQQFEDEIDPEEMLINHLAAHRGRIRKGWIPRARGRATPSNRYEVSIEIFLETRAAMDDDGDEDLF